MNANLFNDGERNDLNLPDRGRGAMPMEKAETERHPWIYFLLVVLISVPGYVLGLVPPYTLAMVGIPVLAASILACRETGWDGVKRLLGRAVDHRRIAQKIWYAPILFLMPAAGILAMAWTSLAGASVPALRVPVLMMPAYLVVFFFAAIGEELGWSGYALDPLQERWSALPSALAIGAVWALWHLVPYSLANPPLWVAGQCASTILVRVLMVWIYNNAGKSVFGMVLFHTTINLVTVPDYGFPYDPVVVSAILAAAAGAVVFLWGPKTLACYRYARQDPPGSPDDP